MKEKRILFVPHCILNPDVSDKTRSTSEIVRMITESGVGIVQLPCPIIEYNKKLVKETRNSKEYGEYCRQLSIKILCDIKKYLDADYKVLGVLGVEFSVSCGVHHTRTSKRKMPGKGTLMRELESGMMKREFQIPLIPANFENVVSTIEKLNSLIKNN
ncbi:MAG: hypothetical protein JW700_03460 [Candidatus Aenigmarchaeota archaeon]|nr:hypothetical protein [Candidatus Aenigmarchaeota archaeon]